MTEPFKSVALTSCNKRKIADAWASNTAFKNTTYIAGWDADKCSSSPPATTTTTTTCGAGQGRTVAGICIQCVPGQFSATNDSNPCTDYSVSSCPAKQGFTPGSAGADSSCDACSAGRFSKAGDTSPCVSAALDQSTTDAIGAINGALATVTNASLGTALGGLAELSMTLVAEGSNGGSGEEQAKKGEEVRTTMVTAIVKISDFANLSDPVTLGALSRALANATNQPTGVTAGVGKTSRETSVELAARFARQSAAVAASPSTQQSLINILSNSLDAGVAWTSKSKFESASTTLLAPSSSPSTISTLVTDAIADISIAQLRGASASTAPVIMRARSIGVVSKRIKLISRVEREGKEVLAIDMAAVSDADYVPLISASRSGAKVVIRGAPALSAPPPGSSSADAATVDLQVTQWSASSNPFNFGATSFDDGSALDGDDVPTPSDLITFTLRHNDASLSESLRVLARPVVFSFPITVDPNITLSPSSTGNNDTCTAMASNATLPDQTSTLPPAVSSARNRVPSSPPSPFLRQSVEVNKTDIVDCAHWDVANRRWSRDSSRGGHCKSMCVCRGGGWEGGGNNFCRPCSFSCLVIRTTTHTGPSNKACVVFS
jgi:hypothetical protein